MSCRPAIPRGFFAEAEEMSSDEEGESIEVEELAAEEVAEEATEDITEEAEA